jgi:hypothetical protein
VASAAKFSGSSHHQYERQVSPPEISKTMIPMASITPAQPRYHLMQLIKSYDKLATGAKDT